MTSGVVRRLPAALSIAWAAVGALPAGDARAACNLIPQAQTLFRGALGSTDRPFAAPGDFVELDVRQTLCDVASADFGALADDHVVTLRLVTKKTD